MKKFLKYALITILALSIIGYFFGNPSDKKDNPEKEINQEDSEEQKKETLNLTNNETEEEKVEEPIEKKEEKEEVQSNEPVNFDPADYETDITYEDLARYPDENSFKALTFTGEVLQTMKSNIGTVQCRLAVNGDINQTVLIEFDPSAFTNKGRLLEGDNIKIYGTSMGLIEYETVLGATMEVPAILVKEFELIK